MKRRKKVKDQSTIQTLIYSFILIQANYTLMHGGHDIKILAKNLQRTRSPPSPEDLFDDHCRDGYPAPYKSGNCSRELLGLVSGEINEMSTCPWTYVHHFNSQR